MIVKPTTNIKDIKKVLCNDVIYDCITDDKCCNSSEFEPPINDNFIYIGGYVDGEIIALMVYHQYRDGNTCHVQVLPDYRKKYAIEFGEQSLSFRGTRPLYARIPTLYQNVINFAELNGFEVIETLKDDHLKNGNLYDVKVMRLKDGVC